MTSLEEIIRTIVREEGRVLFQELRAVEAAQPRPDDDESLTAKEVAKMLGLIRRNGEPNTWAVYNLSRRKRLESFHPSPGVLRFRRGVVRRYIESGGSRT